MERMRFREVGNKVLILRVLLACWESMFYSGGPDGFNDREGRENYQGDQTWVKVNSTSI
jgi:hypothetical protein